MIELPFPAKILWPNGRGHHMAKHREFQKHKDWAYYAMRVEWREGRIPTAALQLPIQWSVTFYPKTRHPIDDDNARGSLKAYQDGFALALKIDDKHFAAPTIHFAEPVKHGKVIIILDSATAMARAAEDGRPSATRSHASHEAPLRGLRPSGFDQAQRG